MGTKRRADTVSEALRRAIRDSGLSLYRVSKDTGVPYAVVHRFVAHGRPVALRTFDKLCAYMGMRLVK